MLSLSIVHLRFVRFLFVTALCALFLCEAPDYPTLFVAVFFFTSVALRDALFLAKDRENFQQEKSFVPKPHVFCSRTQLFRSQRMNLLLH